MLDLDGLAEHARVSELDYFVDKGAFLHHSWIKLGQQIRFNAILHYVVIRLVWGGNGMFFELIGGAVGSGEKTHFARSVH